MKRSSFVRILAVAAIVGTGVAGASASNVATASSSNTPTVTVPILRSGTTNFASLPSAIDVSGATQAPSVGELALMRERQETNKPGNPKSNRQAIGQSTLPSPALGTVAGPGAATGWQGVSHRDQRLAAGGNQFSKEPPDTEICGGAGKLLEMVNTAVRVYDTNGTALSGVKTVSALFGAPLEYDRTPTPPVVGPSTGDVKCYFDPDLQRFFVVSFLFDSGDVGLFGKVATGRNYIGVAVSATNDPMGEWKISYLDGTNDGTYGTPLHTGCPCIPDQPLIGTDKYGFYISVNEFGPYPPSATTTFHGAQIYAFDKVKLGSGNAVSGELISSPRLAEDLGYSIQPQRAASAAMFEPDHNGTAYFLSALDFAGTNDNRIAAWALTGTASLATPTPNVHLSSTVINSQPYGTPPPMTQKSGPTPLRDCLLKDCLGVGRSHEAFPMLSSNDDRMAYAVLGGRNNLWGGLNTGVIQQGRKGTGVAWFNVQVGVAGDNVTGTIIRQGYTAVPGQDVSFPSIAVSATRVVMGVHLMGQNYYPSAAYVDLTSSPTVVRITQAGIEPLDGFTTYKAFGGDGVGRMGDYAGAVAIGGDIFTAVEDAPGGPRTVLANWGTFITKIPG